MKITLDFIRLRHVTKTYPKTKETEEVTALDNISLRIPEGHLAAVVGESGSGKTTLLNLLGGLDRPDSGAVIVNGEDLAELGERELVRFRASRVGFVIQTYYLLPALTAWENVELAMEPNRVPSSERRERARELLKSVGLESRLNHLPGQLSGGEQQRVAIARALANRPILLLADEPTGNLDKKNRYAVLELFLRLARENKITMVVVTHDSRVSERCDLEYSLKNGKLRPTNRTSKKLAEMQAEASRSRDMAAANAQPLARPEPVPDGYESCDREEPTKGDIMP